MPLVYFSGGIDSTVLAFDVAKNPHRYGVVKGKRTKLFLLSYTELSDEHRNAAKDIEKKRKCLDPIVKAITKVSKLEVEHIVHPCDLENHQQEPEPEGGMVSADALVSQYRPDILALPFTPGQLIWASAYAVNYLREVNQPWWKEQAMWGFQWDGPRWRMYDEGKLRRTDISPDFVAALNSVVHAGGEDNIVFRAPYLENRMDRTQIVLMGQEIGVPLHLTSSCTRGFKANCGYCVQCMRRQRTFKHLGIKDV